jgi:stage II sporulation protein E
LAVELEARGCGGRRRCTQEYAAILSKVLNRPMRRAGDGCGGGRGQCRMEFREAGALQVITAGVQMPGGDEVCGDAWCARAVDSRSTLMALSDGMGSGPDAARESAATLGMLRHFYEAGFSDEVICKTINSILLLRSTGEMYATVDLCLFDLVGCRARFIKTGAAPSFIMRGGQVQMLCRPTLPLGILDSVQPAVIHRFLEDQDVVVLMSDGAAGDGRWVAQELPALASLPPQAMAEALLTLSLTHQPQPDDRTVVVARVQQVVADHQLPVNRRLEHWKARIHDLPPAGRDDAGA